MSGTLMRVVLPVVGAAAGSFIPGLGTMAGLAIGEAAAGLLYPLKAPTSMQDLKIQNYSYGSAIPVVYGKMRLAGSVIWANNKSPHQQGGGKGGGGSSFNTYTQSFAVLICAGPVNAITRIWADSQLIYDGHTWAQGVTGSNVRFYLGTNTQLPDTVIQTDKGALTPAFRNRAYVVFQDFDLTNSSGQIPNMEFEVSSSASAVTLDTVIKDLCQRASVTAGSPNVFGLQGSDFDLSALSGITVDGYAVPVRSPAKDMIGPLQDVYHFDLVEIDGLIQGVLRSTNSPVAIPDADLGARPYEQGGQTGSSSGNASADSARIEVTRAQDVELPRRLDFIYRSLGFHYQPGLQSSQRNIGYSSALVTSAVNVVMDDDTARAVADVQLYEAWVRRTGYVVRLPMRQYAVAPGDVLSIPSVAGESRLMKVTEVVAGLPGQIVVTGVAYDPDIYSQSVSGAALTSGGVDVLVAAGTVFILADLPALRPQDSEAPGFYTGACSDGAGVWHGATLYSDRGAGYIPIATYTQPATIGATNTSLPTGVTVGFDTSSTVTVQLDFGSLSSVTETAINNDPTLNACMIGAELLQFATATQTGPPTSNQWILSDLKRGLKSTDTTGHVSGEKFMLLNSAVLRVNIDPSQVGMAFDYKGVTAGVDPSTITTFTVFTVNGNSVLKVPAAPSGVVATGGSASVALTWMPAAQASSYNILRATTSGGPYTQVTTSTTLSYTDTGLTNGTTYYYVIQAMNAAGLSPYSSQVSATPSLALAAPTRLFAATWLDSSSELNASLTCGDVAGATGYNLYYGQTTGSEPVLGSPSVAGVIRPIGFGPSVWSTAFLEFTGTDTGGESPKSAELEIQPPGASEVALYWPTVSGATYNIYRGTSSGGETLLVSGVPAGGHIDGITPGTTYYYQYTYVISGVESARSNEVKATP